MIWLKRTLLVVIIAVVALGCFFVNGWFDRRHEREESAIAEVTARVWVATAKYRNDSDRFIEWRDSLLEAEDMPLEKLLDYLEKYRDRDEEYYPFARKVNFYVDSFCRIEDSILQTLEKAAVDSVSETE